MLLSLAAVIVGLALLIWGADGFVEGATAIAKHLGVSSLIIGITIVGFGTSAPEILVSVIAVLEGTPNLAIGNALGSNIANIGLILGFTAFLVAVPIDRYILKREYPLLLIATLVMVWCLYDLHLDFIDGIILIALLFIMLWYMIDIHHKNGIDTESETVSGNQEAVEHMSFNTAIGWVILGFIVLVGSSKLLVWGASNIALALGVSELIIGLTIVALGTSLPELAASISSLKKGVPDLAVGNVIGSNLFNSLAVIGIPAMLVSFEIDEEVLYRDLPVVAGLTLLLYLLSRFPLSVPHYLTRAKGILLLSCFVIYQLYLYYEAIITTS
ncbi:MAG: calcium/sodium antiporter [Gammaproteobacteria bacterium]|nr:calcium/sodium antiporter [Gammaproteobacteria bacterium]